ncbi:hypothetical protein CBR_g24217 [Chara braunii]|uniref:Uncharacterized protein n=1 Tax=Chara braunii TaxID=69332 RepID=A0A388L638_CHABU|nr:hypothetical protein CBR_g24217 [Chara braunii]|eukprot:GBG77770.1 hypothetical protein CBR_g24217 [Chara braunii]
MLGGIADGTGKVLTIDDLVEALDRRERSQSNVLTIDTFHFNGERVSDWLDLVEQALEGLFDAVKFQRILKYVLHDHHQEVEKVVNATNDSSKCAAMVDTRAEINIIREADAVRFGLEIDRSDCGILHAAVFCGITSNVIIEVGRKAELVLKPFEKEEPWGDKDVQWMMKLALAGTHSLVEEVKTIEEGPYQVEKHKELMGGMYLLVNTLLQGNVDQIDSLSPTENEDVVSESQDDELEEGEIRKAFRAEEYDEIYLELGLLLSCEMRDRDASERVQKMRHLYLRSKRQRDPKPREAMSSRGGQKALATREEELVSVEEGRWAYPECRIGPVVFQRFTGAELSRSPQHVREEVAPSRGSLQKLEALDISQWRVPKAGEGHDESSEEVPREEVHEPERETRQSPERGHAMEEVIEVEEDTPPQAHAAELGPEIVSEIAREEEEEPRQEEIPSPRAEVILSPGVRMEMEQERTDWRREVISTIDRYLVAHAQEHPDIEEPVPMEPPREPHQPEREAGAEIPGKAGHRTRGRVPAGETTEEKGARAGKRVEEIWHERQRLEAVGALPDQPPDAPPKPCDLAGKKIEEASHGVRLETVEAEVRKLRVLVATQAALIQDLRRQPRDGADRTEREEPTEVVDRAGSSRLDTQRKSVLGLSGQPSAVGFPEEPPMGRVILEPEEAKAKREAERETFEFRAPTELATLPTTAVEPMTVAMPLSVEGGQQTASSEPIQGSGEGSMDALLETVDTMQEEASLFSPEQRVEEPPEREMVIAMEGVIEGRPQRLDMPEYRPEEIGVRLEQSTQVLETRHEEPMGIPQSYEVAREDSEAPSSPGSH